MFMKMKTKLLASLFLLVALLLGMAGPAAAQKPIPGIKDTPEYQSLLRYVNFLGTKKSTPASSSQKQTYRTNLTNRRLKTNNKVKSLYQRRLTRIKSRDDEAERRDIKKTRQAQARKVAQLNDQKAARINQAGARYRTRVNQINARYADPIASASAKRKRLKAQLNRTTDPVKREALLAQLDTVNNRLRQLKTARQAKLNEAADQNRSQVREINQTFDDLIADARRFYKGQVERIKEQWKKTYREDVTKATTRRDSEFGLVTRLHDRGAGYIDQMPSPPPPPS